MAKKRFTDEQIINFLREAEIFISQGKPIKEVARQFSITEQTYYLCFLFIRPPCNLRTYAIEPMSGYYAQTHPATPAFSFSNSPSLDSRKCRLAPSDRGPTAQF